MLAWVLNLGFAGGGSGIQPAATNSLTLDSNPTDTPSADGRLADTGITLSIS